MKVDMISNGLGSLMGVEKIQKPREAKQEAKADKVDISREAKKMVRKKPAMDPERIREIRRRIAEGYYDRDEILREVAERILKDPNFRDLLNSPRVDKSV